MGFQETFRLLRGSQKYVGAQDINMSIPYTLETTTRNIIEGDRNLVLNLPDQYDREREESYIYRLYGKINPTVSNVISGCSYDDIMMSYNLYYDPIPLSDTEAVACGYPCTTFFDFITNTQLTSSHNYKELNSYKDNWVIYESYIHSHSHNVAMSWQFDSKTPNNGSFNSGDGIPFYIKNVKIQGKDCLQCICEVEHGLSEGEYAVLQTNSSISTTTNLVSQINGATQLPVFSLGNEFFNNEKKIFNILLNGTSPSINDDDFGVFKRLIDPNNSGETLSQYYTHVHKILTTSDDYILDKAGFESGIYQNKAKTFQANNSPTAGVEHHVVKDEFKSYLWNFNNDLDVGDYQDNLGRPLTDLYLSVFAVNETNIWKLKGAGIGMGWSWNFIPNGDIDPYPNTFVEPNLTTPYNLPQIGETFLGAFVEYNEWELKERVISEIYHKLTFNNEPTDQGYRIFYEEGVSGTFDEVLGGYYYQPHNRIPIRKLSETILVDDNYEYAPQHAIYSTYEELWRWKEILPIGFYESETNGVDYPFVNGCHYPYTNIFFNIYPIIVDKDYGPTQIVTLPISDDCE